MGLLQEDVGVFGTIPNKKPYMAIIGGLLSQVTALKYFFEAGTDPLTLLGIGLITELHTFPPAHHEAAGPPGLPAAC